jgi:hypothetical protein
MPDVLDSIRAQLDASLRHLEQLRELRGVADDTRDPLEHARRVHVRAAALHREAADVHQRAANLFESHAAEVMGADPARAELARRAADHEREASSRERDAADAQDAKADAC